MNRHIDINNPRVRAILISLLAAFFVVFLFSVFSIVRNAANEKSGIVKQAPVQSLKRQPTPLSSEETTSLLYGKKGKPTPLSDKEVDQLLHAGSREVTP